MENSLAKMRPELVTEWSSRNLPDRHSLHSRFLEKRVVGLR